MTHASVVDVLAGKYSVGTTLTVKGWIRTRRDSKAAQVRASTDAQDRPAGVAGDLGQ